jgi:hypothetical protein
MTTAKPADPRGQDVALTIVQNGQRRDITCGELAVGNKLAHDALIALLVAKGIITPQELQGKILELRDRHYRAGEGADSRGPSETDKHPLNRRDKGD